MGRIKKEELDKIIWFHLGELSNAQIEAILDCGYSNPYFDEEYDYSRIVDRLQRNYGKCVCLNCNNGRHTVWDRTEARPILH